MSRVSVRWLAGAATCVLAFACADDAELTRASERARRHLPAFERFGRWADRALSYERTAGKREALGERLFSQLRGNPDVIAAFVRVPGDAPLELALPEGAALDGAPRWLTLRDPERGEVQVAIEGHCPIAFPSRRAGPEPVRCVLISAGAGGKPGAIRAITIAFRD